MPSTDVSMRAAPATAAPGGTHLLDAVSQTTAPVVDVVRPTPAGQGKHTRLDFLDVLRGFAALAVAVYHLGNQPPVGTGAFEWLTHAPINLGAYGVLLFFLVSGFIIPASLERTASLRDFWIGRFFRLVPLFWAVSAAVLLLWRVGALPLPGYVFADKTDLLVGNATLLSHFVGASFLIGPAWTLPFEICFYALTSVLFVSRLRRASVGVALAGAALVLVAAEALLPHSSLTPGATGVPGYAGAPLRVIAAALVLGVAAVALTRSRGAAVYAGVVGFGAALLLLNRPWPLHEAAIYITIMFTGTVVHRIASGVVSARTGWSVVAVVATACCASFALHASPDGPIAWYSHSVALLAAVGTFAAAFAVRARVQWPGALSWLGRVSYSFYLVHWVVMKTVPPLPEFTGHGLLTLAMWLGITLAISELTYRFIERPAVDAGRWVVRRVRSASAAAPVRRVVVM